MLTYTITLENDGNVSLSSINLTDLLQDAVPNTLALDAPGVAFVSSTGGDADARMGR